MARRTEKRSFGSIRRLPSGNYQARYTAPSGAVVPAPTTFKARIDAEAWLLKERKQVEDPESWQSPKARALSATREADAKRLPTLRTYAEQWIDNRRNSRGEPLRPLTRDKYRSTLVNHVLPVLGELPLDEITRESVRSWHASLLIGPSAKAHAYATLRTILNSAVDEDELLQRNPARLRGAGVGGSRKTIRPASIQELGVMVEAMPERLRLLLLLATWCSLRSGEVRELRRQDVQLVVDEEGATAAWIHVTRGFTRARNMTGDSSRRTVGLVGPPKTQAGVRSVSVPDFLLPTLQDHLNDFTSPGDEGLLFASSRDPEAQLSESTLNGRAAVLDANGEVRRVGFGWREARRVAGRSDLDLHDLRHTGASWAGEEGASLAELMHRLGHSTPSMAMRYQHSRLERDRELGRRLSARAARLSTTST